MKILILGAGPAGLTLGNKLKDKGFDSFLILEKEDEPGGLCRSIEIDGAPFDIGGPHFLDDRNPEVMDYIFRFLPKSEWTAFDRNSKIMLPDGQIIGSPIEANIWQMNIEDQVDYLESISTAGCNKGTPIPEKFVDWIRWKLGNKIAENYMLPYNAKLYGENLNEMGTYWLYKLPSVSFRETIMSCLEHKPYGKQPCQTVFYYPVKHGSGELWKRMADNLQGHIKYGVSVDRLDLDACAVKTSDGEVYKADMILTTIPWAEYKEIRGLPQTLAVKLPLLKTTTLEVRYVREEIDTDAQWVYCAGEQVPFHRFTRRRNIIPNACGMGVETRIERTDLFGDRYPAVYTHINEYSYPVNTIEKPGIMAELLQFTAGKQVYGVGRWGEHQHHNSDTVVELAMKFVDELKI